MDVSASNICLFVNFIALLLEPDIRDDKTATTFNDHSTGVYKTLPTFNVRLNVLLIT